MDKSYPQELHQVDSDPGDVVIRDQEHSHHNPTVSFGPDWSGPKFIKVLDVVNYYKPNAKNQLYLPENSFFNSQGKVRAHVGGETTFRGDPVYNRNKQIPTRTNNETFDNTFKDFESEDSDNDTLVPEVRSKGLFEVPLDVYSMPRLIATFKGFSKIVTPRAVRLLTFLESEEGKLLCKVDKNSLRFLQKNIGDLEVVSVSFTGDPKSGKSFLASLLVGKENTSFNVSESFVDPNNMLTNGSVWVYVAVYQEKHAYVFLDFEGFEHCEDTRVKMLLFSFAVSNLVICNIKYSLMSGIYNSVRAMISLTKRPSRNESLGQDEVLDKDESEFLEIFKNKGSRLLSYDTQNFTEFVKDTEEMTYEQERKLWNPPIVQFVFRDCSGFVKCIDDRIFTPETLVEQGLFENYLDLFSTCERDPNFKNEMLDSFEVFTNRKYLSLPHPTLSTHPFNDYQDEEGLNFTDLFMRLLSSDKSDFKRLTRFGYNDFDLNTNLSSIFNEKLDQLKSLIYHDTLNYAKAHSHLNGRMFGEYIKSLANLFNSSNNFTTEDLNELLSKVFLGENSSVLKESLLRFLRQIRSKVAPKLPMDSKFLLNMVLSAKFSSINYFESNAFGTPEEYKHQLDELSDTIESLMKKLEDKNRKLMTSKLSNYLERKEASIRESILKGNYEVEDLDEDLSKLKESLNSKFYDGELVTKLLLRSSQNLVRLFNDTHPDTFVHNLSFSNSSSIEEIFESLNTDIASITSNLNNLVLPKTSKQHLSGSGEFVSIDKNENYSNSLQHNDNDEELVDDEDEESFELPEEDQQEPLEEQDQIEEEEVNEEEVEVGEEEDDEWVLAESGGTKSFSTDSYNFESQNSDYRTQYSENLYDGEVQQNDKEDETIQVKDDFFQNEDLDEGDEEGEEEDEEEYEEEDLDKTPKYNSDKKQTVLRKIIEKSAEKFSEIRGAKNVPLKS